MSTLSAEAFGPQRWAQAVEADAVRAALRLPSSACGEVTRGAWQKNWPLRCPSCRDRVLVELPRDAEPGHSGTETCVRGHSFIFQYDGAHVEVVGGIHVRGRHRT